MLYVQINKSDLFESVQERVKAFMVIPLGQEQ